MRSLGSARRASAFGFSRQPRVCGGNSPTSATPLGGVAGCCGGSAAICPGKGGACKAEADRADGSTGKGGRAAVVCEDGKAGRADGVFPALLGNTGKGGGAGSWGSRSGCRDTAAAPGGTGNVGPVADKEAAASSGKGTPTLPGGTGSVGRVTAVALAEASCCGGGGGGLGNGFFSGFRSCVANCCSEA